jgi:2-keto-4-pentenoate hydratase/2-oxohepta-3-ene-1,7-dioic acid hydratase in catechol pathway
LTEQRAGRTEATIKTPMDVEVRVTLPDGSSAAGLFDGNTVIVDGQRLDAGAVEFQCPTTPTKIICIGMNYADHIKEMDLPTWKEPTLFLKPPSALVGHDASVVWPPGVERLDYEGELVVVIGERCRSVSIEHAMEAVLGLTIGNDFTARDKQKPNSQWTVSKGYDGFAAVGPGVVPTRDWEGRELITRVNGEVVQRGNTNDLVHGVPELVSYISDVMTLEPGDLIYTGTPSGVGGMSIGDVVEVEIFGVGLLRNTIVAPSNDGGSDGRVARKEPT